MKSIGELKSRINGITDTRKITGAMETISIVKMRRALSKYQSNLYYMGRIRAAIKHILDNSAGLSHRYLIDRSPDRERPAYIVIASDKGLCGGYNHNVLNYAFKQMHAEDDPYVITLGHMGAEFFERKKIRTNTDFAHIMFSPTVRDAIRLTDAVLDLYDKKIADEIYVVYTAMERSLCVPSVFKLLPLIHGEVTGGEISDYDDGMYYRELEYYPSADDVLDELIPQYITAMIYSALLQSLASEHSSRMTAMSSATKNADAILERLNLEYNRARQETITNELSEIIASAKSVESK